MGLPKAERNTQKVLQYMKSQETNLGETSGSVIHVIDWTECVLSSSTFVNHNIEQNHVLSTEFSVV